MWETVLHTGSSHPDLWWIVVSGLLSFVAGLGVGIGLGRDDSTEGANRLSDSGAAEGEPHPREA